MISFKKMNKIESKKDSEQIDAIETTTKQIEEIEQIIADNLEKISKRGENLEHLKETCNNLEIKANELYKEKL